MKFPEENRWRSGEWATKTGDQFGLFYFVDGPKEIKVIATSGLCKDAFGWDHVSVSLFNRTPLWEEMCFIKSKFWDDEDCVIQFHPPKSQYVNNHPYCLHLWKHVSGDILVPPTSLVGVK